MKDNRNDRQYGQSSSGQQQNLARESNPENWSTEGRSSGSAMGNESYEQEEYSSDDDLDELDDMDDDQMISRIDEEEDLDILDEEDENSTLNQRGRQGSGFGSESTR
jgi:hypothetical protein